MCVLHIYIYMLYIYNVVYIYIITCVIYIYMVLIYLFTNQRLTCWGAPPNVRLRQGIEGSTQVILASLVASHELRLLLGALEVWIPELDLDAGHPANFSRT